MTNPETSRTHTTGAALLYSADGKFRFPLGCDIMGKHKQAVTTLNAVPNHSNSKLLAYASHP